MSKRVVVLFPVGQTEPVEAFRRRWDPLAAEVPAHITLAYPFASPGPADELAAALAPLARSIEPFPVALGNATVEHDEYLFLLADEGAEAIRVLHDRLYDGPLAALAKPDRFLPHMTVGRQGDGPSIRRAEHEAREELLSFSGAVVAMSVYRIEEHSRVREFDLPLGSTHG